MNTGKNRNQIMYSAYSDNIEKVFNEIKNDSSDFFIACNFTIC